MNRRSFLCVCGGGALLAISGVPLLGSTGKVGTVASTLIAEMQDGLRQSALDDLGRAAANTKSALFYNMANSFQVCSIRRGG